MRATIYLIIATFFWGLNYYLAKIMLKQVNFVEAGFWRYLFGAITLFFISLKTFPSLKLIKKRAWGIILVGVIGLFGFNYFFFLGLIKGSAVSASLIISLNPAMTLLLSFFILKTKLEIKHIIGVIFAFIGVIYLILKGNFSGLGMLTFSKSDLYILISCVVFAFYNVWVKIYSVDFSNTSFTFLTSLVCVITYAFTIPFYGFNTDFSHNLEFWLAAVGVGALGTAVAYYTWNLGIKIKGAGQAGIFMNLIPLFTAVLGLLFDEKLYHYHYASGLIIILGMIIMNFKLKKKKIQTSTP
ncbi:DMT family transporter [Aureivirga sp. CE67]|uniref:DMT family transporter n=1 Tax=Aureivirga sp. CE67 TaxID=1788983 RepID=UPI0018CAF21E|nr:DMT family transporter [Aureivirga sp. CE67]